jgi:hypothetical protein
MAKTAASLPASPAARAKALAEVEYAADVVWYDCPECADQTAFVTPLCDEHDDCPELACVECGYALVVEVASATGPEHVAGRTTRPLRRSA